MLLLILFPVCGSSVWTRPFYESAYKTPTNVIYVPQSTLYGNPDTSRYRLVAVPQFAELSRSIQVVGDSLIAEPDQLAMGGGYDPYGRRMQRRRYGVQPPRAVMRSHRGMPQWSGMQSRSQTNTESSNRMNTQLNVDAESSYMGAPNTENEVNHENGQTDMFTPTPDSMPTPAPNSQTGDDLEMTYQTRNETVPEQMSGMQSGSQTDTESSNRVNTELPSNAESSNTGTPNRGNEVNHENGQTDMLAPTPDSMLTPAPNSQTGADLERTYQTRNETVPEQPPLDVELQGPQMQRLKCSAF